MNIVISDLCDFAINAEISGLYFLAVQPPHFIEESRVARDSLKIPSVVTFKETCITGY